MTTTSDPRNPRHKLYRVITLRELRSKYRFAVLQTVLWGVLATLSTFVSAEYQELPVVIPILVWLLAGSAAYSAGVTRTLWIYQKKEMNS